MNSNMARRLCAEISTISSEGTFAGIHQRLWVCGTFRRGTSDCGTIRHIRNPDVEENVIDINAKQP